MGQAALVVFEVFDQNHLAAGDQAKLKAYNPTTVKRYKRRRAIGILPKAQHADFIRDIRWIRQL